MIAVTIAAVVTMAATNVRDVSNREIKRWEFHRDPRSLSGPRLLILRRDFSIFPFLQ
jgi:hypothetical protein